MKRYKKDINESCSFCKQAPEDIYHLFWSCPHLQLFWNNLTTFIRQHISSNFTLSYQDVLFGFFSVPSPQTDQYYIINLILFLAKAHIHNRKFTNQIPSSCRLKKEIKQYIYTVTYSQNKKAIKTIQLFSMFPCL